jgi:hypothetical protein
LGIQNGDVDGLKDHNENDAVDVTTLAVGTGAMLLDRQS